MLKFALCDDNSVFVNKLSKMLESIFIKHNFSAEISIVTEDADSLLEHISQNKQIDVLLIDIDLKNNISGLDLVNQIRKSNKKMYIIFTTAHLEYGLLAYKCKTFDYLPKPITMERLEETIFRLFEDIDQAHEHFIKLVNKHIVVKESTIYYIKKDGMKLIFKTKTHDYEMYSTFKNIEKELPDYFIRCHKSYIVNLNNISNVYPRQK